ncbi:hypothetical protein JJD82_14205 [Pseudomonas sp. MF6747]|nr:hypothetical protein [Pseudomonas sp. MF6747]
MEAMGIRWVKPRSCGMGCGCTTKEVRGWMRDPDNYELEYYSHNRSKGALLTDRYKDPGDFIGPAEKPKYY